jgi:predicted Zn finger-like uncharacterized protein
MAGTLQVSCPSCGASSSRVPDRLAGRAVRCPRCGTRFTVPEDAPAPTVPEPSAPLLPTQPEPAPPPPPPAEAPRRAATGTPEWQAGDLVLGLYEVVGVLGRGGMGIVYRVRHRGWGLDLALKVPLPRVLAAAGGADLFEREAETWVNLGLHPHVVTCHYVRRLDGSPAVFAEYADGGSLHEAIRGGRLASAEAILDVAVQFAWGLHHAHEQGLVHRDVKPANVMLTSDGFAKVTDFGLARARSARLAHDPRATAGHTMTVEGGGGATPAYVSPEQARGEAMSRRSDAWSFGLSLLEMFLGKRTWDMGLSAPEVLAAQRGEPRPEQGRPQMPPRVAGLLERCFRERPEERPHDLGEIAAELRAAWEEQAGRPYPRPEPKGGRGSADALNNRAASLVDLGRAHEAAALWRRALEAEPLHIEATYNAAVAGWAQAQLVDAELLRRMEEACASRPHSTRGLPLLERVQTLLGLQTATALRRAVELGVIAAGERADAGATPTLARTLRGLAGPVGAIATTPDGAFVIAAAERELRVWRASDGELVQSMTVAVGPIRALLALRDGRSLVVAAEGAPLTVWDLSSGRAARSFALQAGFATCLAPAGQGALVLSGGSDRVVRLWDPQSGRCTLEMSGHEDAVTSVVSGEGVLASASRDGSVRVWSPADGRCLAVLRGHKGRVLAVALCERESRLVSAGDDGLVADWGLRSRQIVRAYVSHALPVQTLLLSADGARIVSGGSDRSVRGFDTEGERLSFLCRLDAAVQALAWGADGTLWAAHGSAVSAVRPAALSLPATALCRPASASDEQERATSFEAHLTQARRSLERGDLATAIQLARTARSIPGRERAGAALAVWDELCARLPRVALISAWEEARLEGHGEPILGVAVDPTGAAAATGSLDATVRLWDLPARRLRLTLAGHGAAVTGVAFAAAGSQVVSSSRDRTLRLWDAASGAGLATLEGHEETVAGVDVAPDGVRAASAGWDGCVRLWDLRRRALRGVLRHAANVAAVRFSLDGQVLASAAWDGTAHLWDPETGQELGVLRGHDGNVTALAWHPGGRQLATGGEDRSVRLFDPRSKKELRALAGHEAEVTGLAFTADGRFLLSASRDRTVRAWDLRRAEAVRTLTHPDMVLGLGLGPAGGVLLTAGADRTARVWHLDWDPETDAVARDTTLSRGLASVRTVVPRRAALGASTTLRDELVSASTSAVQVPRAAALAARRLPWRWLALAAIVAASVLISFFFSWRRPAPRLRLSPLADEVRAEVDLIDLAAFVHRCSPSDYDTHLQALRSGNPDAHDVACVGSRASAATVADVLDGAPLDGPDALATRRLRRNAASALAGAGADAVPALCDRLADPRAEVRATAALALGVVAHEEANACLQELGARGSGPAKAAAASALRQRVSRGLLGVQPGWALVQALLHDPAPEARVGGLAAAPLFAFGYADPAVQALLDDPDPDVAAAARAARSAVAGAHRMQQLSGDSGS